MATSKTGILKIVGIIAALGILSGSGYAFVTLYKERNRLRTDLHSTQRRADLLQRKYSQEKARSTALMRTKQSLEGTIRAKQTEIDQAKAEKQALEEELSGLEAKYAAKTKHLEEKIDTLFARIESIKASREEVVARYKEKVAIIRDNEEKIAQLSEDLQRTGFELKRTNRQLDNCTENNERLCLITEELVDKYKQKGVVGSLMVTEPFTQLEKVEVEKLVQEYTDRIEKERID